MYIIESNEKFAEEYRELMLDNADAIANIYNMTRKEAIQDIPTKKEIINMIVNHDVSTLRDDLNELKIRYNEYYDDEDPDCGAALLKISVLLNYIMEV